MKRTFAAIDISEEARRSATNHIDLLRRAFPRLRVGWERPEKLHFTLKFFGDVEIALIPDLRHILVAAAAASDCFTATIEGTGRFPPKGDPRLLWLGAKDGGRMRILAENITDAARPLGILPERRRFEPHLTIARLREPSRSHELSSTHLNARFEPVPFDIRNVVLYESTLLQSGSVYHKICEAPLCGA